MFNTTSQLHWNWGCSKGGSESSREPTPAMDSACVVTDRNPEKNGVYFYFISNLLPIW